MSKQLSYVIRGKNRRLVLEQLIEPRTPTEVSARTQIQRSAVSRAVLELEKRGMVKCLTPNEKMGRLYTLTSSGKKILEIVKKRG